MRITHLNDLPGALRTITTVLLFYAIAVAAFAQGADDSWIDGTAPPEQIRNFYTGEGELEDAAKQAVAFATIYRYSGIAIRRTIGRQWTPREEVFREAYDDAENEITDAIREKYGRTSDEYLAYEDMKSAFRDDARNRLQILERFAPSIAEIVGPDLRAQAERQARFRLTGMIGGLILVSAGIGLIYLLVGSVRDRRISFGLDVEESDDRTIVRYQPGRHGIGTVFSVYGSYVAIGLFVGVLAAIGAVMFAVSRDYAWMEQQIPDWLLPMFTAEFWWLALLALLATPIWILAAANFRRRAQREVVITRDDIRGRGETLERQRIGEIYVWGVGEGGDDDEEREATVLIGGNAASRAAAVGQLHGANIRGSVSRVRRALGRVGHQICVDYGEQRRVIASQLPFQRAHLVLQAIEQAASRLHGRVSVDGVVTRAGD